LRREEVVKNRQTTPPRNVNKMHLEPRKRLHVISLILSITRIAKSESILSMVSPSHSSATEQSLQVFKVGHQSSDTNNMPTMVTQNGSSPSTTSDKYAHTIKHHSDTKSVGPSFIIKISTNSPTPSIHYESLTASTIQSQIISKSEVLPSSSSYFIVTQSVSVNITLKNNTSAESTASAPSNFTGTINATESQSNKNEKITIILTNNNSSIAVDQGNVTQTPKPTTAVTKKATPFILKPSTTLDEFCTELKIPERFCVCPNLGGICAFFSTKKVATVKTALVCSDIHLFEMYITIVICSVGILGNLLVLLVSYNNSNTKENTTCRKLIAMLALTDLFFCVLQLTTSIPRAWTCGWIYKDALCKFLTSMINSTAIMGLGFILIISVERFNGIVRPFLITDSGKKVYIFSAVNIMLAVIVVIPAILVLKVQETVNGESVCSEKWPNNKYSLAYSWFLLLITFLLPIFVISYLYIGIVKSLRKSQQHTEKTFDRSQQSRRRKEDTRITLIIACLLFNFILLVSPNRILWVLYDHGVFSNFTSDQLSYVKIASGVPYTVHACVNPLIYSVVDRKFCGGLLMLYYRFTCRHKRMVAARNGKKYSLGPEQQSLSSTRQTTTSSVSGIHTDVS